MKLYILIDYKGNFGSKWGSEPYNSGFDKQLLIKLFKESGINLVFQNFKDVKDVSLYKDEYVLYISSEDIDYKYKSYIEDIVYHLELNGAKLLPPYPFLKANNNKVFMSLLEKKYAKNWGGALETQVYGTQEDLLMEIDNISFPIVVKEAAGAMSKGVYLAKNKEELLAISSKISKTVNLKQDIKDKLRPFKHKGYQINSVNRNKFVLQEFVPNLKNDWKILIYGDKYYVLTRHIKGSDFRASGSHFNYLAGSNAILPDGLLNFAKTVFESFNVPHLSIDVVFDGRKFYLIEYQALYFGTSTYNMSDVYFKFIKDRWEQIENNITIENAFANSVIKFIKK